MSAWWDYRLIWHDTDKDRSKHWIGLHEVYWKDGAVQSWTEEPIRFACDAEEGIDGIRKSLAMALRDAMCKPSLLESDISK